MNEPNELMNKPKDSLNEPKDSLNEHLIKIVLEYISLTPKYTNELLNKQKYC